tara:strand:+ start:22 stop:408 length:387 start_codon:yes stop_codon:yes gene_type:complete
MGALLIAKQVLKAGVKTKAGKKLIADLKKTKAYNDSGLKGLFASKAANKAKKVSKADKKVDALLTAANISLPVAGIYGLTEIIGKENEEKATKKLIAQSNAATKQDAVAKLKKTGGTAAQRFKDRYGK